ncbi:hypothetical protein [Mucilaginibacter lacusdianchii]|uniref:hypothetical protein n=1 Tax=Mucilaginibacter lacusdianchii TaxID=2684211 RepID=UPI00131EB81B|nr:hypothetical protein [Mucilaginibacter sp. JXJ CY 39]
MPVYKRYLPGFKTTCLSVCVLYVLIAGSLLVKGLMKSMAQYHQVPSHLLTSPHYYDAVLWMYMHMLVIGLIIGALGWYSKNVVFQKQMSRVLFAAHLIYTYLDFRSSDFIWGNGLYHGLVSVVPAVVSLVVTLLFLNLGFGARRAFHPGQPVAYRGNYR